MKILIIGNGGREHALAWKIAKSPLVSSVFIAPGNAGTALEPNMKNVLIGITDIVKLLDFAKNQKIDLTIVGPEIPISLGIVDIFRLTGLKIFGPTRAAAQLEISKTFTKNFLIRHNIPTAKYQSFNQVESAVMYLRNQNMPIVIKADGLASGKGVIVATTFDEAEIAVKNILERKIFGRAGSQIIIEEFLDGEEVSFITMVDGKNILPLTSSQDHKRVYDGDTGLNTGGMGAYSPVSLVTNKMFLRIINDIIQPTIKGMELEGNIYTGCLYAGLIIDKLGNPKVIEFNCRFGDPETQSIVFRLKSDLADLCISVCDGTLNKRKIEWNDYYSLGVIMATKNYPEKYSIGNEIYGLPTTEVEENLKIFHSGTKLSSDNRILTNGGRVLCVTALDKNITEAQRRVYKFIESIHWNGSFNRRDIGYREINRSKLIK